MEQKIKGITWFDGGNSSGPAVIFIHGFPFNHSMWEPQLYPLSKNFRLVSYDVRGHGQSEVGDGQYSLEFFVDDLIVGMDYLKIGQAILCGLSMGGYIALRAVERHPDRFKGLVLCDTKSQADSDAAKIKRASAIRAVKRSGAGLFADEFVKTVVAKKTLEQNSRILEMIKNLIRGNSQLGICGTLLALASRTDTTVSLDKITIPTLILVGQEDSLTPVADAESMQKHIPKAALHVIPEAGHLSNLENPTAFNKALVEFLNQFISK